MGEFDNLAAATDVKGIFWQWKTVDCHLHKVCGS